MKAQTRCVCRYFNSHIKMHCVATYVATNVFYNNNCIYVALHLRLYLYSTETAFMRQCTLSEFSDKMSLDPTKYCR